MYNPGVDSKMIGYVDSSWAEDDKSQSTGGYNFLCGGGVISWRSKKLGGVNSSSTEAEYRSYLSASQEAQWLRKLTFDVHGQEPGTTKIWSDNQGGIQLAKNHVFHSRTKHISVHYNMTKDVVANQEVKFEYIPTEHMVADIFTKALDRVKHLRFVQGLGLVSWKEIEPVVRGCVETEVRAHLCVLPTRSPAKDIKVKVRLSNDKH